VPVATAYTTLPTNAAAVPYWQVFPYHVRLRGPPTANTAAVDRGLWFNKPFYTGDQEGGVVFDTFPELHVGDCHE
jgi:hypothetical protein